MSKYDDYLAAKVEGWEPEVNDIPPIPGAKRLEVTNPQTKLPEGVHAGVWEVWDEERGAQIWKPLDVRPYVNCPRRYASRELEALEVGNRITNLTNTGFPFNWVIRLANNRLWLVRDKAWVIPDTMSGGYLQFWRVLELEQVLKRFNSMGWEIQDHIRIAVDKRSGIPFFLDLSAANVTFDWATDDQERFYKWCENNQHEWLAKLRRYFKHEVCAITVLSRYGKFYRGHVYVSRFNYDKDNAFLPDQEHIARRYTGEERLAYYDYSTQNLEEVVSFVITNEAIPAATALEYGLHMGWEPIEKDWGNGEDTTS